MLPIVFITSLVVFLINTLALRPAAALAGLGIVIIGIPAYVYLRRKKSELNY